MKCSTKRTTISCLTTSWMIMAALLFLSHLLVIGVQAQDAGADDGGGDTGGDGSDLTQGDPNIVNTPNKQGYGKDVSTNVRKTTAMKITPQDKTIAEQSIQALFQLGVLVSSWLPSQRCQCWRSCEYFRLALPLWSGFCSCSILAWIFAWRQ